MFVALLALLPVFTLDTEATRSNYLKTGHYDEVVAACEAARKDGARCDVIGTSPEGRPMLAISIDSAPGRPTVLVIGGIHAGEIDGKDAALFLVDELLNKKRLSNDVNLVFVPVYNVDGHERFGKNHRPNQRGPEEMGWRVTGQNLNLNRDWMKADAPETRALTALINRIDPVVTIDLHVTDGAQFQHDISVIVEPQVDDGSDTPLVAAGRQLSAALQKSLTAAGHLPLDFYPSFEVDDDPFSGIAVGVTPARFTHGYAARRGRLGVLVETHSWRPYKERVMATVDLLHGFLQIAATQAASWAQAAALVDNQRRSLPGKKVTLAFDSDTDKKGTFAFQGYEFTRSPSEISGGIWTRYNEKKKQVWNIPLWREVKATATTTAPAAYAVQPAFAPFVVEQLTTHGISFQRLATERTVSAESWRATEVVFAARPYEGRMTAKPKGSWTPTTTTTLPKGTLLVPVGQPRGRLVMEFFEPDASESFVRWGFFNACFEQKEYMEGYVAEGEARSQLAHDKALQKAFAEKLMAEPAFAKDAEARLDFFYRRHPAFDARKDLLPVLRIGAL